MICGNCGTTQATNGRRCVNCGTLRHGATPGAATAAAAGGNWLPVGTTGPFPNWPIDPSNGLPQVPAGTPPPTWAVYPAPVLPPTVVAPPPVGTPTAAPVAAAPAPAAGTPVVVNNPTQPPSGIGTGTVVLIVLLAVALAIGGTIGALVLSGHWSSPTPPSSGGNGGNGGSGGNGGTNTTTPAPPVVVQQPTPIIFGSGQPGGMRFRMRVIIPVQSGVQLGGAPVVVQQPTPQTTVTITTMGDAGPQLADAPSSGG